MTQIISVTETISLSLSLSLSETTPPSRAPLKNNCAEKEFKDFTLALHHLPPDSIWLSLSDLHRGHRSERTWEPTIAVKQAVRQREREREEEDRIYR